VPVRAEALNAPFRMAVQWVNRPNSEFRGYSGRIASGRVRPGDSVTVQPSGRTSTVARIYTADGDLPEAGEDESVTLVLADQIDASRGQVIVATDAPMRVTATVERIISRIDPETGRPGPAERLSANDIADVSLRLDRAVAVDAYAENRETGSLILIDRETTDTAALGLVLAPKVAPAQAATPGVKPADGGGFLARLGRLFGR
jgi:sulfate adenylyltransferase subunit 1